MSDGNPTLYHRITQSRTVPAPPSVGVAVKLLLPLCTFEWFPTILRSLLERLDTLSEATAQSNSPDIVPDLFGLPLVRNPVLQGWYPNSSSTALALPLRQPPTYPVHAYRIPVSSWSKVYGLSVLAQVTSIFTGISISPGALLTVPKSFSRGRNLPDKEFRYP